MTDIRTIHDLGREISKLRLQLALRWEKHLKDLYKLETLIGQRERPTRAETLKHLKAQEEAKTPITMSVYYQKGHMRSYEMATVSASKWGESSVDDWFWVELDPNDKVGQDMALGDKMRWNDEVRGFQGRSDMFCHFGYPIGFFAVANKAQQARVGEYWDKYRQLEQEYSDVVVQ